MWQEIERLQRYTPIPALDPAINEARHAHYASLQAQQNPVLQAWAEKRKPEIQASALTTASQPVLDGISALTQLATAEIERLTLLNQQQAQRALWRSLAISAALLAILLLAICYVLRKIIKPLEVLERDLRGLINESGICSASRTSNEIVCLQEAIALVTHLWKEKSRLEDELRNFAFQDSLTQLPNRRLLMERIQQACIKNERRNRYACLLFLDIDKFKQINDQHGHELGDQLLIAVAKRLQLLLREEDTIARLGGDEFIVLIEDLGSNAEVAHKTALAICTKLDRDLAQPYVLESGSMSCSVSIGHKVFHGSAEDMHTLIRDADTDTDTDMYLCKSQREGWLFSTQANSES